MSETGYTCPDCGSWLSHWIDRDYIQCDNCDYEWNPDEEGGDCEYQCPRCGSNRLGVEGDDCECLDCGLAGETYNFEN